jgi:P27 family predicted phage terminase small subunit
VPAGRPPKPTELKILQGDRSDRINTAEPKPSAVATLEPPVELAPRARPLWDRLAPDMARKRVLTDWDRETLANYCRAQAMADEAAMDVDKNGGWVTEVQKELPDGTIVYKTSRNPAYTVWREQVALTVTLGSHLGLTPAARTKITTREDKPKEKGAERLLS